MELFSRGLNGLGQLREGWVAVFKVLEEWATLSAGWRG